MNRADRLVQNFENIRTSVARACRVSGRDTAEVNILAVTKYAADQDVLTLLEAGKLKHVGESRVQQAVQRWKSPAFAKHHTIKHFIGHLQKNKAAQAAELFDFIDSLDDVHTAQALDNRAQALGKTLRVMVQIKLTDRQTQSGVDIERAPLLVKELRAFPHLLVCGYMSIAPQTDNVQTLRALFKQVRQTFERDFPAAGGERYLSLGMSNDFETAVEEGSTLPRVGSKLFAANLEEL